MHLSDLRCKQQHSPAWQPSRHPDENRRLRWAALGIVELCGPAVCRVPLPSHLPWGAVSPGECPAGCSGDLSLLATWPRPFSAAVSQGDTFTCVYPVWPVGMETVWGRAEKPGEELSSTELWKLQLDTWRHMQGPGYAVRVRWHHSPCKRTMMGPGTQPCAAGSFPSCCKTLLRLHPAASPQHLGGHLAPVTSLLSSVSAWGCRHTVRASCCTV